MVNTSPDIVDDACNFAWMEFMRCQPDRDRNWRSWLVTTAQREAWRLHADDTRDLGGPEVVLDDAQHPPGKYPSPGRPR